MTDIPPLTPEEAEHQTKLIGTALVAYAQGDKTLSIDALSRLADRSSDVTVLFMLANAVVRFTPDLHIDDDSFVGFDVVNYRTGEVENPEQVLTDLEGQAALWCFRFITATANKDHETQKALIAATASRDQAQQRMAMLLHIAGGVVRDELEKTK